ncbi:MAG TPA: ABC transporter substrate-binding protein [Methylomirabilota bacterium]|nr:ABC transporter substrate-binding protein [Methylomirabilota bacterium]
MSIVNRPISIRAWRCLPILVGAVLILVHPLTAAGAEIGGKPEKGEVTIAYVSPSAAFTPLFVAAEAGLFAKYGLKVKLQFLNTAVAINGLLADEVDFCADGPAFITPRLGGAPVKYSGAYMQRYVFQIWGAKDITKIEQLKGKVVAVQIPRGAIDIATRETLKKYGLIPDSDVKFTYVQQGTPAILSSVVTGNASAGTLSAPITLEAQRAGLNLLVDIAELNILGLQGAYGTTEKFLSNNPNTIYAFSKAMAEGVVLARKDSVAAKRAIGNYLKIDDPKILDASYGGYAPYWEMNLAVRDPVIRAELNYLDARKFPQAKDANPKEFFDNSFVDSLEKSGFFASIGWSKQK